MIPSGEDFDYYVSRENANNSTTSGSRSQASYCLSENARPHMFRGRTLDLKFGGATYNDRGVSINPNVTHIWAKGMSTQHHGFDTIGTINMETKEFDGVIISRKIVIRDNKGKLAAVVKRMDGQEDWQGDIFEIYSVKPRYSRQTPTWAYKDLPLYCWARVNPNNSSTATCSLALPSTTTTAAPSYSLETTGNEYEELFMTYEVGSKLTRRRKMVFRDPINNGYTRAYAYQTHRPLFTNFVKECQRHPCATWRINIGPSTDPFLMIAFLTCIEQLQQSHKNRI